MGTICLPLKLLMPRLSSMPIRSECLWVTVRLQPFWAWESLIILQEMTSSCVKKKKSLSTCCSKIQFIKKSSPRTPFSSVISLNLANIYEHLLYASTLEITYIPSNSLKISSCILCVTNIHSGTYYISETNTNYENILGALVYSKLIAWYFLESYGFPEISIKVQIFPLKSCFNTSEFFTFKILLSYMTEMWILQKL